MQIQLKYEKNQILADTVATELADYDDEQFFHIDVYGLAEKFNVSRKDLLDIFVKGVYDGVFVLDWVYHCPICGGVAHETISIHQAESKNYCPACKADFNNTLDDNIEVFFSIHPNIKLLDSKLKEKYAENIINDIMSGNYLTWKNPHNIRGIDIIQNNTYRDLMKTEMLISDQSLKIMKVAILFTDIKGSTQMYTDLGDTRAFSLVRDHFRILFDVIKRFNGVPVKTIGDAVMGAFISPEKAVEASIEAQKELIAYYTDKDEKEKILVKIGVHSGPALIVTLNDRLDYFGTTVNMAARIQGIALPNEVAISEELFEDKHIKHSIASITKTVKRQVASFKGLDGKYNIYHVPVNPLNIA